MMPLSVTAGGEVMATKADLKLRKLHVDWINSQPYEFDLAVAWHLPNSFKAAYHAYDHLALSSNLRHYFNCLDTSVFKTAYKRKNIRLPRAIVLEHSDQVGWHAHGLISSHSSKLSRDALMELLKSKWHKHLGKHGKDNFSRYLTWVEPSDGFYAGYIAKNFTAIEWEYSAKFDYENCYLAN
jgi:hypothetical protein